MTFFDQSPRRTTLEVTYRGRAHSLSGDQAVLFEARVARGIDFEFTFPGDNEPTTVDFNGLRVVTKTTIAED